MLSLPSPPASSSSSSPSSSTPSRPSFNSHRTQDRLREGETPYVLFRTETSNLQRGRKSVFKETGLLDDTDINLNIVASSAAVTINVSDEDDSSASGVSLLQSPIASPASEAEAEAQQTAPFPPLQDVHVSVQRPVQARSALDSWYVWALFLARCRSR
ncbi:hypothetical protein BBK36DRAFT_1138359 [Trichoderma citrinoviride]|uniref:Uncharacterized protein n=1 Tax=Trichoderma citrinoviride TaxID=58853 RepID=A0A2T4BKW9_9HYPO|nr:hypothetical protein BBK36DRAFT_1138359 [Trichoderma citrinoviride]PTB69947.1 hypothetical protein BBK36DRAFT_1138359 [Trichoderma citrinoviride]